MRGKRRKLKSKGAVFFCIGPGSVGADGEGERLWSAGNKEKKTWVGLSC